MKKFKQTHFDQMLRQGFLEEAKRIEVPSSKKLWVDLQKRLDSATIQNAEEKISQLQQPLLKKKPVLQKYYDIFWKKNKFWTGIAAACLVIFIISLQVTSSPKMKNFVQEFLTFMGTETGTAHLEEMCIITEDENTIPLENGEGQNEILGAKRAAPPPPTDEADASDDSGTESFDLNIDDNHHKQIILMQEEQEETSERDLDLKLEERLTEEKLMQEGALPKDGSQEVFLQKKEAFISELKKYKHLAPEKIWQINTVPQGFTFCEAVINKTDDFLLGVSLKYTKEEKNFSFRQDFFLSKPPDEKASITTDGLARPIRVGLYHGHLICDKNGLNTITWIQDNSIVTLSGHLEEKELFRIIDALKEF